MICFYGQTTKQPLSNVEPLNIKNISKFKVFGLTLVVYQKTRFLDSTSLGELF